MINRTLNQVGLPPLEWRSSYAIFLPLALWTLLWLSLFNLDAPFKFFNPGNIKAIFAQSREVFPMATAGLAAAIILFKASRQPVHGSLLKGPLGLAAVYGVVGLFSSLLSPDGSGALFWALAYLSVPLVIWALAWESDAQSQISLLINYNWLLVVVAITTLFIIALLQLDLGDLILSPSSWSRCNLYSNYHGNSWVNLTGGALRPTGVGRYAAVASLIALTMLWRGHHRPFWGVIFFMAMVLLLTSGARTSYLGFAGGAILVSFLLGNRKAALAGVIAAAVILPVLWGTGSLGTFTSKCLLRTWANQGVPIGGQTEPGNTNNSNSASLPQELDMPDDGIIPEGFFQFTGRTGVWKEGVELVGESPFLGWGFQADRLIIGAHMHNAYINALLQTGFIGGLSFFAAILLGWYLMVRVVLAFGRIPASQQLIVAQAGGLLIFMSIRAFFESSGTFYGVDWLFLGPVLLYLQIVNKTQPRGPEEA